MSAYPWFVSAKRILSLVFPPDKSPYSILDLGCLEGGYATEFARMGFQALGIEVRANNIAACQYVKEHVNLPNLSFVQDDAWNAHNYGSFDAVFCCGLLYHFDQPRTFLEMLSKITKRVVIIQTHFAGENPPAKYNLSELTEWDGVEGRWYTEYLAAPDAETRESSKLSSWNNMKSLWMTRPWILQSLNDMGFDLVLEQFDSLAPSIVTNMTTGHYHTDDRATFVGIRTEGLRDLFYQPESNIAVPGHSLKEEQEVQTLAARLAERERLQSTQVAEKEKQITILSQHLADREKQIEKMTSSISWRIRERVLAIYLLLPYRLRAMITGGLHRLLTSSSAAADPGSAGVKKAPH